MRLTFGCKPDLRRAIEPLIKKHAHLVPSWCHVLHCNFSTEGAEEGVVASITPMTEYRKAYLYVHAGFLTDDAEEREHSIVHELLHLQVAPLESLVSQLIKSTITPDSTLAEWSWEERRRATESVVEDLRLAFERATTLGRKS